MKRHGRMLAGAAEVAMLLIAAQYTPGAAQSTACRRMELTGEVNAAQEYKASIGEGWAFRVRPIGSGYSGWDLVVDREPGAGFPDALLLATPPYDSINEREIGTTFGVRAQDAVGWNPRSFRFLTDARAFAQSQQAYRAMKQGAYASPLDTAAAAALMARVKRGSVGQFRILDARLTPGVADAAPFAADWAAQSAKTPHTIEEAPEGQSSPRGALQWIRFAVTLWLPDGWKGPDSLHPARTACPR